MKLRMFCTPRACTSGLTSTISNALTFSGWRAVKVIELMPPMDMPARRKRERPRTSVIASTSPAWVWRA